MLLVAEATLRSVDAEAKFVHVAVLDVLVRVLEGAVRLLALAVLGEKAAHRHTAGLELVQEPAGVALHAETAQPVATDSLRASRRVSCVCCACQQ